jgi:hypothetical protein
MSQIESFDQSHLHIGSGDIKNATYCLEVEDDLSNLFTLPPIRLSDFDPEGRVSLSGEDGILSPDTWITPRLKVLPMGWNWALHLCQSFTSHTVATAAPLAGYFGDHSGARRLTHPDGALVTCYVDNFLVVRHNPKVVDDTLAAINQKFTNLGCVVHEQCSASREGEFVGLAFRNGVFRIKPKRIWRLRFALLKLTCLKHCTGRLLEIIIGHVTWAMLMRRESLSLLDHVYRFIHFDRDSCKLIPPEVRNDLLNVSAILPLLRADCHLSWAELVHASDASPTGLGVCGRTLPSGSVGQIGRIAEKWAPC